MEVAAAATIRSSQPSEKHLLQLSIFTGKILHLSLNIIKYPVIVDVELKENAVVTIDNTILIECTNAPTHLHTTVYATETATVTKTILTVTITAQQVAAPSDEATRTVLTDFSTKGHSTP